MPYRDIAPDSGIARFEQTLSQMRQQIQMLLQRPVGGGSGDVGPPGPAGPAGPAGATGATGPAGTASAWPVVATLPTTPANGDIVYYQTSAMATLGRVWPLRYRSSGGTYKWEAIGAAELAAFTNASVASSAVATWQLVTDPQIIVPLAGDYEVFGAGMFANSGGAIVGGLGPTWGGAATPASGAGQAAMIAFETASMSWWTEALGVAAGTVFQLSQYTSDTTPANSASTTRRIWVRPLRVG